MSRGDDRVEERPGDGWQWPPDDDPFDDFDSDGALDDPDRDTDFATMYHEDEPEQEPPYFDDPPEDHAQTCRRAPAGGVSNKLSQPDHASPPGCSGGR